MRKLGVHVALVGLLVLLVGAAAGGQEEGVVDLSWAGVESIDVLDSAAGDFLDFDIAALEKAAWEAYQAQEWENAARYYLAYIRYNATDGGNIYNLACCYGLMGEADLAAMYLDRAVRAGFTDIEHISWDPDFDSVRESEVFASTMDRITAAAAEEEARLGDIFYIEAPVYQSGRLMLPADFDPEEPHMLVVGLHGYGSNPDRFITLWERFADPDFIYVSPRAPYPFSVGNEVGYSWDTSAPGHEEILYEVGMLTEVFVADVVREMKSRYNIDKVYLMGFSQGCGYTYLAGIHNHELFDGLICFGGRLDTDLLSEEDIRAANHLRVFIGHGTEDRMVELETGIAARDLLLDCGYDVTFHEFEGGHSVPEEVCLAAQEWMKE
jgi:phospholipase/carboxylesterase